MACSGALTDHRLAAAGRDHQGLAAAQVVATQVVGQLELLHAHPVILGDAREGVAAGDLIGAGADALALGQIGQGQLQGIGILDRYQQAIGPLGEVDQRVRAGLTSFS